MPRARARCLFELGGQWIAEEPGRIGFFYRFWNDARTGRTRRASLGTADFEEAKNRLADIVIRGAPKTSDSHLTVVLEDYFLKRTDHLVSKKPARHAGALLLECWGQMVKTSAIDEANQKIFIDWSIQRNHSMGYIARNMGVLASAIAHAKLNIDIIYNESVMLAKWPDLKPKPAREIYEPSDAELARLLRAPMPEDLRRWIMNAMATVGRPEAVLGLCPAQRTRDVRLMALNPPDRRQNKKYRATVREPRVMTAWLDKWEKAGLAKHAGRYCGYASVDSVDTALRRVCARPDVNLPRLGVYSFRHKGTTVLRKARVPEEQINYQEGHRKKENRSSRSYGEYDPGYLKEAADALDAWIRRVQKLAKAPVNSHRIPTTTRLEKRKAA